MGKIFKYIVLPLSIFLFFSGLFTHIIEKFLVNPILSFVKYGIISDILVLSLILYVAIWLTKIHKRNVDIPEMYIYIGANLIGIYLYYRFYDRASFSFIKSAILPRFYLSDYINFFLFVYLFPVRQILKKDNEIKSFPNKIINKGSLRSDISCVLNKDNDVFNRIIVVKDLVDYILRADVRQESFSIGIVAPWGNGKTTIMDSIKTSKELDTYLKLSINVWQLGTSIKIIDGFFASLLTILKPFSLTIDNKINKYAKALIEDNGGFRQLMKLIVPDLDIEKQSQKIQKELQLINKKIIVFIDDIDRLDKNEIYEVVRLVRNTANFPNIVFIVAYDKGYITSALENINNYRPHIYLEKIFQFEYLLPPVDKDIVYDILMKDLDSIDENIKSERRSIDWLRKYGKPEERSLVTNVVCNIRDINRFINLFEFEYLKSPNEILFKDMFYLCLLKLKYPTIMMMLIENQSEYLFFKTIPVGYQQFDDFYVLNRKKEGNSTVLEKYLRSGISEMKYSSYEIQTIISLLNILFPSIDDNEHFQPSEKSYLAFHRPENLSRYLNYSVKIDLLSETEFDIMENATLDKFNDLLANENFSERKYVKIWERFGNTGIKHLNDIKIFLEKMFLIADVGHERGRNYSSFSINELNRVLKKYQVHNDLYKRNELKEILRDLFDETDYQYSYINHFVYELYHNPYIVTFVNEKEETIPFFEQDQLYSYLEVYLEYALKKYNRVKDVWIFVLDCRKEERLYSSENSNSYSSRYDYTDNVKELVRNFIQKNDVEGFITLAVQPARGQNDPNYQINEILDKFYGSFDEFIQVNFERRDVDQGYILELAQLNEYAKANGGVFPKTMIKKIQPNVHQD